MGTLHHLPLDDGPRLRHVLRHDPTDDLELPSWEEFTSARDRFFENLATASELYRAGLPQSRAALADVPGE